MHKKLLLLMLSFISGCDTQEMKNEAANKSDAGYTILQSYEYDYREAKQDKPYMVFEHALNSNFTVVAFPIKDKPKGYVAILAQAEGVPKVKVSTEANFVVTKETYAAVKAEASLSKEVDEFIAAHVR